MHRPEVKEDSAQTQMSYDIGHAVGEIAQQIYGEDGKAILIEADRQNFNNAFTKTQESLPKRTPIFEAGFKIEGALAFADVLLPLDGPHSNQWRMVEIKSSTSVKDYYHDDIAIQSFIAKQAGLELQSIALAHVDNTWVYQGDGNYQGLLKEVDLTQGASSRGEEVKNWINEAQVIADETNEPCIRTGKHCHEPFECGFLAYCQSQEPQAEYPANWLPRIQAKALKQAISEMEVADLRKIDDSLLNEKQLRVKQHSISGMTYFNAVAARAELARYPLPAVFLDFETINMAVPIWKGTRPYQQIPFQLSAHLIDGSGQLEQKYFLDISGRDPSEGFITSLIDVSGKEGPIFVYSGFENTQIKALAERFPHHAADLNAICGRLVDLLKIAQEHYYHPSQQGSWSIKKILPTIAPELNYDDLDGVQDGGSAQAAFMEGIHPDTAVDQKTVIEKQLLDYCAMDTLAMVRLWQFFK
ncbi:DUF2779 domain-containing protein [Nitrosomonas sp.]|uniref:DUF2779 domain-containing protein n=1 Tax=Nitrosomonas sp. TaxID=42353 RepID=UPI00374CD127